MGARQSLELKKVTFSSASRDATVVSVVATHRSHTASAFASAGKSTFKIAVPNSVSPPTFYSQAGSPFALANGDIISGRFTYEAAADA